MKKRVIALIVLMAMVIGMTSQMVSAKESNAYQVGYAKLDINPEVNGEWLAIPMAGGAETKTRLTNKKVDDNGDGIVDANDGLFVTCVAITGSDGNTVLVISTDLCSAYSVYVNPARQAILDAYAAEGVTADRILINASHNHSGPMLVSSWESHANYGAQLKTYREYLVSQIVNAAGQALSNRAAATMTKGSIDASEYAKTHTTVGDTLNSLRTTSVKQITATDRVYNTVRHYKITGTASNGQTHTYICGDNFNANYGIGVWYTYDGVSYKVTAKETVTTADDTMQVVKFTFSNGADPIAMINWRAHTAIYDKSGSAYRDVTSDYVNSLRYALEVNGYRAAFLQGAAGNINAGSQLEVGDWLKNDAHKTATENRYEYKHLIYGTELAEVALECLDNAKYQENVAVGEIRSLQNVYHAARKQVSIFEHMAGKQYQLAEIESGNQVYTAETLYYYVDENGTPLIYTQADQKADSAHVEGTRMVDENGNELTGTGVKVTPDAPVTIASVFHANTMVEQYRNNGIAGEDLELNAVTIGDFTLVAAPGEPFDNYPDENGKNMWDDVGADFILGYTNLGGGYLSSAQTFEYNKDNIYQATGSYETMSNAIGKGTGEGVVQTLAQMTGILAQAEIEGTAGYCAHCKKDVQWVALGDGLTTNVLASGHYTVSDETLTGVDAMEGAKICIDLGGNTLRIEEGFTVAYGAELSILGSGAVEGDKVVDASGGVFSVAEGGTLNLYEATLRYVGECGSAGNSSTASVGANGRTISSGGILYVNGVFNMFGGVVEGTNVIKSGGAVLVDSAGYANIRGGKITDKEPTVGYNAGGLGDCVRVCGQISLAGNAQLDGLFFHGQTENTEIAWEDRLIIDGTYTGSVKLQYGTVDISAFKPTHIAATNENLVFNHVVGKVINGGSIVDANITVSNKDADSKAYAPQVVDGDIKLLPVTNFIGEIKNGESVTYLYGTFDEVVAAVPENGRVIVQKNPKTDLTIPKNLQLELKGNSITGTVTVNQGVTLQVADNATADYDVADGKYGKIKTAGNGTVMGAPATEDSDVYLPIDESNGYKSYHAVGLNIDGMSLNVEQQGMYFVHTFEGSSKVQELVEYYGMALSVDSAPTEESLQEEITTVLNGNVSKRGSVVFTVDGSDFNSSDAATSTLVTGIMKTANGYLTNKRNAGTKIYGRAYIKLKNSNTYVMGVARSRSLQDQIEGIDERQWGTYDQEQKNVILKMYETKAYGNVMDTWTIPNIKDPAQQQAAEEQEVLRILGIGNSHTCDATWLLYEVFSKEMPEQKVMIGNMYYSGCTVAKHVDFEKNNSTVYVYYTNEDGSWKEQKNATLNTGVEDQVWDVVMLHEMNRNVIPKSNYTNNNLQTHINNVKEHTIGTPTIMWNFSWANPVAEEYFAEDYSVKAPGGWRDNYVKVSQLNYNTMLSQMAEMTQRYVIKNKNISAVAPTGTAICYARNVMGLTDLELYRDYTHMSDFGRLISAYVWYATITGQDEITEVNVDVIPSRLRHERFWSQGDLEITPEMKQIIIESVNFALENPWTVSTGN